jgi:hypothetical protein
MAKVAREIFLRFLCEMYVQRLRNPPETVSEHNAMNMEAVIYHHVPKVLFGFLGNGKVRNKNALREQWSPLW